MSAYHDDDRDAPEGMIKVVTPYIHHPKTKLRIYPKKGRVFVFFVPKDKKRL